MRVCVLGIIVALVLAACSPEKERVVFVAVRSSEASDPGNGMGGMSAPEPTWLDELLGETRAEATGLDVVDQALKLSAVNEYTLVQGDTATKVAEDHGLTVETILSYNKIQSPRTLRPGQVLKIPSRDGIVVSTEEPLSVEELAENYDAKAELIRLANRAAPEQEALSGDVFIPGARMDPLELRKLLGEYFLWPTVGGRISSFFGRRNDPFTGARSYHSGVDIANWHGAPVLAAGAGVVTYTGYDRILGYHIRVDQGQGFMVVYGHLSAIQTKVGARVAAGQKIGKVGNTGYSTGPHLHFAAYRWGKLLNPMMLFG